MEMQNKKMLEEINQAEFLQKICKETPKITIGTQCGVGIYQFKNALYLRMFSVIRSPSQAGNFWGRGSRS